ncbi:hypothetical protein VTL71DRAFT_16515 [Oculimacula yallundae]|uniref:Uncharacterized protein n=1 Tax=Oculimacula yallundae TaxID=86028 RepID=A0ABR4CFW7_9HELO
MANDVKWLSQSTSYAPAFDDAKEILLALKDFQANTLSAETTISWLRRTGLNSSELTLSDDTLQKAFDEIDVGGHHILLINRFLVLSRRAPIPLDSAKLRISASAFRMLISRLHLPAPFVYALTRYHLPCGRGFGTQKDDKTGEIFHEMWYFLPLRVQYKCTDKGKEHEGSTAGSNQMNPFHYLLHLSDVGIDVRGSRIAIFSRYNSAGKIMVTTAISFMDGRWSKTALEPKSRIKDCWERRGELETPSDPFQVHCVFFTSAVRWWTNTLDGVNEQLMAYERRLHEAINTDSQVSTLGILNKALHAVAAHLQRYHTELESIDETWQDIAKRHLQYEVRSAIISKEAGYQGVGSTHFDHTVSHLKQIRAFLKELMTKVQNNLALLFNCIQLTNDRRLVTNGENMHAILLASRDEARSSKEIAEQSIKLSEEMKQDSVAMKTIAVTTMFFLPGTSFATFLSMPFFDSMTYLNNPRTCWIWVTCTIPSTIVAFAFYFYWRHREQARKRTRAAVAS